MGALERLGCTLRYAVEGEGPPVVLIHGANVGGAAWGSQLSALTPRYRCLTFDNRGFGESQPLGGELSVEVMADDVLALMDAEGFESAHLVGHSMGGLVAQFVAKKARARVRSLSLLCTFADGKIPSRLSWWLISVGARSRIGSRAMRRRAFLEMVLAPSELTGVDRDKLAETMGRAFGADLADQPPIAMKQVSAMKRADATAVLPELAGIPTLVVSAEHDRLAPPSAGKAIAAGIPGARYVEIPGAAHAVSVSRADALNALLLEHLSAAEAQKSAA